jgi:hypothetical protein
VRVVATIVLVLCVAAAPAFAKKRVALLGIEGKGGLVVRDAVDEVLQREVTVL